MFAASIAEPGSHVISTNRAFFDRKTVRAKQRRNALCDTAKPMIFINFYFAIAHQKNIKHSQDK
jgi:hypothetical protein